MNFQGKNSGTPLELLVMEMIVKVKMVTMEKKPITTVETNTRLAESLIEDHINNMHHAEKSFRKDNSTLSVLCEIFESFTWCCEHSPVEGSIEISYLDNNSIVKHISVPVETNFVVVCTKEQEKKFNISWSYSLS